MSMDMRPGGGGGGVGGEGGGGQGSTVPPSPILPTIFGFNIRVEFGEIFGRDFLLLLLLFFFFTCDIFVQCKL